MTVDVSGGPGGSGPPNGTTGDGGHFLYGSNTATSAFGSVQAGSTNATIGGLKATNPFLTGGSNTTPYIAGLEGAPRSTDWCRQAAA